MAGFMECSDPLFLVGNDTALLLCSDPDFYKGFLNIILCDDVDLKQIAQTTAGFTGADLF